MDRGSWSVEIILTLLAFKCLYPSHMHLTRGNHEAKSMNTIYGGWGGWAEQQGGGGGALPACPVGFLPGLLDTNTLACRSHGAELPAHL